MMAPAVPCWMLNLMTVSAGTAGTLFVQSTIIISVGLFIAFLIPRKYALYHNYLYRGIFISALLCPLISVVLYSAGCHFLAIDFGGFTAEPEQQVERFEPVRMPPPEFRTVDNDNGAQKAPVLRIIGKRGHQRMAELVGFGVDKLTTVVFTAHSMIRRMSDRIGEKNRSYLLIGFLSFWIFASCVRLIIFIRQYFAVQSVVRYASATSRETMLNVRSVAKRLCVDRPLVYESDESDSPFVTGFFRQILILPSGLSPTEEMLLHEFAHLKRSDCRWNFIASIAGVIYPVQPLLSMLTRRLDASNDLIADDYVLLYGGEARSYAGQLYSLAEYFSALRSASYAGAYLITVKSNLRLRIERLLRPKCSRSVVLGRPVSVLTVSALTVMTIVTGMLYVAPIEQLQTEQAFVVQSIERIIHRVPAPHPVRPQEVSPVEITPQVRVDHMVSSKHSAYDSVSFSLPAEDEALADIARPAGEDDARFMVDEVLLEDAFVSVSDEALPDEKVVNSDKPLVADIVDIAEMDEIGVVDEYDFLDSVGENEEVFDPVGDIIDVDPNTVDDINLCKEYGDRLYRYGHYVKAEFFFNRAMEFDPDDPEVRNSLGLIYKAKRDTGLAILYFKLAVALKPDYAEAYRNLGDTVLYRGNAPEAWKYYKIALNLNPGLARRKDGPIGSL